MNSDDTMQPAGAGPAPDLLALGERIDGAAPGGPGPVTGIEELGGPVAQPVAATMLPQLIGMSFAIIGSAFPFVIERFTPEVQQQIATKLLPIAIEYQWDFSKINKRVMLWLDLGAVVAIPGAALLGDIKKMRAEAEAKKPPTGDAAASSAAVKTDGEAAAGPVATNIHLAAALK